MSTRLPANMRNKITETPCSVPGFGPCWSWTGAVTSSGYGTVAHDGRTRSTHRLAFELLVGPIPAGLTIDHLCENELCCKPRHLEPATSTENLRRSRCGHEIGPQKPPVVRTGPSLIEIFEHFFGERAAS